MWSKHITKVMYTGGVFQGYGLIPKPRRWCQSLEEFEGVAKSFEGVLKEPKSCQIMFGRPFWPFQSCQINVWKTLLALPKLPNQILEDPLKVAKSFWRCQINIWKTLWRFGGAKSFLEVPNQIWRTHFILEELPNHFGGAKSNLEDPLYFREVAKLE